MLRRTEKYGKKIGKKINDINCLIYSGIYKQTQIALRQIRVFLLMNFKVKVWWYTFMFNAGKHD